MLSLQKIPMQPIQTLRLAAVTLLLTAGLPLIPALNFSFPAVAQTQTTADRKTEADRLLQQGYQQVKISQFTAALQSWQQALVLYREIKNRQGEGTSLGNLGVAYASLGNYGKAIEFYQQSLAIAREIKDRPSEGAALNNLGVAYASLGNYGKAIEFYQQHLAIAREIKDRQSESNDLGNLGVFYYRLGNYAKAIEYHEQDLAIAREIKDRKGEGNALGNLGSAYFSLGNYAKAIEYHEQSLAIARETKDRKGEGNALGNLGIAYYAMGNYDRAIEYHEQSLAIARETKDRKGEGASLANLGNTYDALGNYGKAIEFHQRSLAIFQEIKNRQGEGLSLSNLGIAYDALGNYGKSIEFHQQSLAIKREIKDRQGEGVSLGNLGIAYKSRGNYGKAIEYYQQSLAISREIKDRRGEGNALGNLGNAYSALGNYGKSSEFHQQSLATKREIKDREGERISLNNIGSTLQKQKQSDLAIVFYKQSVNVSESIRQPLRTLSRNLQESYAQSVSGTYRALADLLLAQGRILEAQQVLELLKIQEIREFTREAKTTTSAGIATTASETKILKEHGSLIAFGQKVTDCKQSRCAQLSQLNDQQQALTQQYNQTVSSFEKEIRQRKSVDAAVLDPRNLSAKAKEIVESQPGTVLIYPFVLEDKIWLLWAAKGGIVKSVAVPVSRKQLGETVLKFRNAVQSKSPGDRPAIVTSGKQLYDWLIKPLEPELKANKIQNLVFSLDRVTRYIPMSALFDGKQYLIENYAISTILSAELTDLRDRLPASNQTSILAMGASEFKDDFPLPSVPAELDAIIQQKSQTQSSSKSNSGFSGSKFLNQAFTFRALRDNLVGRKILHIATHGKFVAGRPEDSFLVLGNSEKLTIPEIKTLQDLSNIHLVVLSACQTALGGDQDGIEISGLSSYFLSNGAKAVMASLWIVDDASTSLLMAEFYRILASSTAQKTMTKAEALRQAQLSLIREGGNFALPYYWAPFILIGNGL